MKALASYNVHLLPQGGNFALSVTPKTFEADVIGGAARSEAQHREDIGAPLSRDTMQTLRQAVEASRPNKVESAIFAGGAELIVLAGLSRLTHDPEHQDMATNAGIVLKEIGEQAAALGILLPPTSIEQSHPLI